MRLLLESDLPWLHSIFRRRYPNHDAHTTERWFLSFALKDANMFAARTDDAFLVAMMVVLPWLPGDPEVNVVCICADDDAGWQVIKLLRSSIEWSRKRNAARWRLNSDTGYDVRPMAMRVGAHEVNPRFEIDLRGGPK